MLIVIIISMDKRFFLFNVHILIGNVPTRTAKLNFGDNGCPQFRWRQFIKCGLGNDSYDDFRTSVEWAAPYSPVSTVISVSMISKNVTTTNVSLLSRTTVGTSMFWEKSLISNAQANHFLPFPLEHTPRLLLLLAIHFLENFSGNRMSLVIVLDTILCWLVFFSVIS